MIRPPTSAPRTGGRRVADAEVEPVSADLKRAGGGAQDAFARVVDALGPMVYGVALQVARSEPLAEEIAQEVFVEAWRLAPQFDPARGTARAWLATIAHRRAVDRVRSEQSRRNREEHEGRFITRPHDGVSEAVLERLDQGRLTEALASLSEGQRQAIEMAYYEGRTYRDVAAQLGIAEGTAKTRIREGLHRLRIAMGATP